MKFLIEVDEADGQHLHRLLEQNSLGHLVFLVRTEAGNGYREVEAEGVHEVFGITDREPTSSDRGAQSCGLVHPPTEHCGPGPHQDEPMKPYPASKLEWS